MNQAMSEFRNRLFKAEHKSYYTQQDMDILDQYRTVANVGWLRQARPRAQTARQSVGAPAQDELVEIDVS